MSLINQELSYLVFGLDVDLDVLGQRQSRLQVQLLVGHARGWELLKRQVELLTLARCRNEDSGFCDVTDECYVARRRDAAWQLRRDERDLEVLEGRRRRPVEAVGEGDEELVAGLSAGRVGRVEEPVRWSEVGWLSERRLRRDVEAAIENDQRGVQNATCWEKKENN